MVQAWGSLASLIPQGSLWPVTLKRLPLPLSVSLAGQAADMQTFDQLGWGGLFRGVLHVNHLGFVCQQRHV